MKNNQKLAENWPTVVKIKYIKNKILLKTEQNASRKISRIHHLPNVYFSFPDANVIVDIYQNSPRRISPTARNVDTFPFSYHPFSIENAPQREMLW